MYTMLDFMKYKIKNSKNAAIWDFVGIDHQVKPQVYLKLSSSQKIKIKGIS